MADVRRYAEGTEVAPEKSRSEIESLLRSLSGPEETARRKRWVESEERRRWRAQLLLIKAKLEMIATGETTVEREFLADMVLPDGGTVSTRIAASLAETYSTGMSVPLLGAGGAHD